MEELPSPIMSLCASLAAGNPVHFLAENTQMWPRFSPTGPRTKYPEKPGYSHSLKSQASLKEKQRPTEQDGIDERWQCEIYLTVFREAIKKRFILEKFSQICEPTHPPQCFGEIWEHKRWYSGQKGDFCDYLFFWGVGCFPLVIY